MGSRGHIILLIEDSQSTRFMYRKILDNAGFFVIEAENGETGLQLIKQHHPDLVVLDLILPGIHGLEVLRRIRAEQSSRHTPVLVLTNVKDADQVQKTLSSGANHYAYKESVTDQHILDIVNELLGLK
ncbi:response regulator [bacterium]|nr:response regulator [bacterium]